MNSSFKNRWAMIFAAAGGIGSTTARETASADEYLSNSLEVAPTPS